jgi:predicted PilT family ATPase
LQWLKTPLIVQARQRELAERKKLLAELEAGKVPKLDKDVPSDEEPEEDPTLEFEVPRHKVKLIIGAGGERIKQIQRKTRTRIQVCHTYIKDRK